MMTMVTKTVQRPDNFITVVLFLKTGKKLIFNKPPKPKFEVAEKSVFLFVYFVLKNSISGLIFGIF